MIHNDGIREAEFNSKFSYGRKVEGVLIALLIGKKLTGKYVRSIQNGVPAAGLIMNV